MYGTLVKIPFWLVVKFKSHSDTGKMNANAAIWIRSIFVSKMIHFTVTFSIRLTARFENRRNHCYATHNHKQIIEQSKFYSRKNQHRKMQFLKKLFWNVWICGVYFTCFGYRFIHVKCLPLWNRIISEFWLNIWIMNLITFWKKRDFFIQIKKWNRINKNEPFSTFGWHIFSLSIAFNSMACVEMWRSKWQWLHKKLVPI